MVDVFLSLKPTYTSNEKNNTFNGIFSIDWL